MIHAPPSKAELDIMLHEYLLELSKQGTAKKHELMLAKEEMILKDGKLTMHGTTKFINYTKVKSVI